MGEADSVAGIFLKEPLINYTRSAFLPKKPQIVRSGPSAGNGGRAVLPKAKKTCRNAVARRHSRRYGREAVAPAQCDQRFLNSRLPDLMECRNLVRLQHDRAEPMANGCRYRHGQGAPEHHASGGGPDRRAADTRG